jgi:hypothetical protein
MVECHVIVFIVDLIVIICLWGHFQRGLTKVEDLPRMWITTFHSLGTRIGHWHYLSASSASWTPWYELLFLAKPSQPRWNKTRETMNNNINLSSNKLFYSVFTETEKLTNIYHFQDYLVPKRLSLSLSLSLPLSLILAIIFWLNVWDLPKYMQNEIGNNHSSHVFP